MPKRNMPMPKGFQIFLLKKKFGDLDAIDWEAIVDDNLTFPENLTQITNEYALEILLAQIADGVKTEKDLEAEFAQKDSRRSDEAEAMFRTMKECDWEIEPEKTAPEENAESADPEGWHLEPTPEGETYSIEVEIEPHTVSSKGKRYVYGRIQLSLDPKFLGLTAKITINVPKELL